MLLKITQLMKDKRSRIGQIKQRKKNKNELPDSKFVWKVQGSPKNGLLLKRFLKLTQATGCN